VGDPNTATLCNTLQHTAIYNNTGALAAARAIDLTSVVMWVIKALQNTATHCNTLQHTATQVHWQQHEQ